METNVKTSEIGKRISELIFHYGKNQSTFAQAIGVSHTTVRNLINSITKPRHEVLDAILKAYPEINPDWLFSGTGQMLKTDNEMSKQDSSLELTLWQTLKENYERRIEELQYTISLQKQLLGKHRPAPVRPNASKVLLFTPTCLVQKIEG